MSMERGATLKFRRVQMSDLWTLYAWRMEHQTAFWSLNPTPPIDKHLEWMRKAVGNEDIYVAENESVGMVAVMQVVDTDDVGITVNPLVRGCGHGKQCIKFLQGRYPHLRATVIVGNTHSLRLFTGCGFVIEDAQIVKHRPCILLGWSKE